MTKEYKSNGFTLIELLSVIIILGVLMLIAIPSVTMYINNTRKEAYISTAKNYMKGAIPLLNSGDLEVFDQSVTYYVPYSCIETDGASQSPYAEFDEAYILATYHDSSFKYYWMSLDKAGIGIDEITQYENLTSEKIKTELTRLNTEVGIGDRETIHKYNSDCSSYEVKPATAMVGEEGGAVPPAIYSITFDAQGGTDCETITANDGSTWGSLCTTTKENNDFGGWFTEPEGAGVEVKETDTAEESLTLYAKWTEIYVPDPDVCIRATTLHEKTCGVSTNDYCNKTSDSGAVEKVGYNNKITYGQLGTEGEINYGDAYDCDVNGDGDYTERFYVVVKSSDTIGLIYSSNTVEGVKSNGKAGYGTTASNPNTAISNLPNKSQWSNDAIVDPENGKAARLLSNAELSTACGLPVKNEGGLIGELNACQYLFENTKFENTSYTSQGFWLSTATNTKVVVAGGSKMRRWLESQLGTQNNIGVRPVITVPIDRIEI